MYSYEQWEKAVEYYLEHGKNVNRTCRILGCPSRTILTQWIIEDIENGKCTFLEST